MSHSPTVVGKREVDTMVGGLEVGGRDGRDEFPFYSTVVGQQIQTNTSVISSSLSPNSEGRTYTGYI